MENSNVTQPLRALVERTLRVLTNDPMVFFLGAGASAASPSLLPQPSSIQDAVFDCVAPTGAAEDRDLIANSLPEIYHEVLLDVGGEETRDIWRVLSLWESPQEAPSLSGLRIGPNLVHLLVVYLSWKAKKPVLTVNFDQMLERASESLGLRPEVSLSARPTTDGVAIWKIHGSVDDLPSIRTTLQGITAMNPELLDTVKNEFSSATGCLIGYSGRDIDFFPFLCDWKRNQEASVYWLSLRLDRTAIQQFPGPFLGVDARAEEWARAVIARLPTVDPVAALLKSVAHQETPTASSTSEAYLSALRKHAMRTYARSFPPGAPRRILAHAMTLAALGKNVKAEFWADRFLAEPSTPELRCRAHLLKSALSHEFARYVDSKRHAESAKVLAEFNDLRSQADEAQLRIVEAERMLYVPPRVHFIRLRDLLTQRSLSTLSRMLNQAVRLRHLGRSIEQRTTLPQYDELRAGFEYLEHLIRVGAILQGMVETIASGRIVHLLFDRYWRWIESRCYTAGYALGIGNAKKYRLRRNPTLEESDSPLSVLKLYELIPSPTGSSIHYRDVADLMVARSRRPGSGTALDSRSKILHLYEAALQCAREAGDPSLQIKAMLGIQAVDPQRVWPREELVDLTSRIQSPAFEKVADYLIDSLSSRRCP